LICEVAIEGIPIANEVAVSVAPKIGTTIFPEVVGPALAVAVIPTVPGMRPFAAVSSRLLSKVITLALTFRAIGLVTMLMVMIFPVASVPAVQALSLAGLVVVMTLPAAAVTPFAKMGLSAVRVIDCPAAIAASVMSVNSRLAPTTSFAVRSVIAPPRTCDTLTKPMRASRAAADFMMTRGRLGREGDL